MKHRLLLLAYGTLVLVIILSSQSCIAGRCGPERVWVPGHRTPDGTWIKGFCRPVRKAGFVWVEGHRGPQQNWIPGHWKPIDPPPSGKVWVPGYVNAKGKWVPGYYRVEHAPDKAWVPGH